MSVAMLMDGEVATIDDYIRAYKNEDLTIDALYLQKVLTTKKNYLILNWDNLMVKYMPEFRAIKKRIRLNDKEYIKYRYNPKRLSYDLYGTTELWFLIMEANELYSIYEFDLRVVDLYNTSLVNRILRVINLEEEFKDYNKDEINNLLNK